MDNRGNGLDYLESERPIKDEFKSIATQQVMIQCELDKAQRSKTMNKQIEEMAKDLTETKAQGFKIENGKLVYFSNMLDGYKREFKDLQEICEEMNGMLNNFNSLMSQIEFWQSEAKTYKHWKGNLIEQIRQSRKATAREILQTAKFLIEERNGMDGYDLEDVSVDGVIVVEVFDELAEQYGVEI